MPSLTQPIPLSPLTTIEKPNVAPTILWVPETGNLRAVATRSQTHEPKKYVEVRHENYIDLHSDNEKYRKLSLPK